jgi:hypothetical protein
MTETYPFSIRKHRRLWQCIFLGCQNHLSSIRTVPYCRYCYTKMWRHRNPLRYKYQNLKNRAKQREIPFELTFSEYLASMSRQGITLRDFFKTDDEGFHLTMSLDREKEDQPYRFDNVRWVTLSENSRLSHARRKAMLAE